MKPSSPTKSPDVKVTNRDLLTRSLEGMIIILLAISVFLKTLTFSEQKILVHLYLQLTYTKNVKAFESLSNVLEHYKLKKEAA